MAIKSFHWWLVPLAALIGLAVGTWGSRDDIERAKQMREDSAASRKASDAAGFGAFAKMVNIPEVARRPSRARSAKPSSHEEKADAAGDVATANATNAAPSEATPEMPPPGRKAISPEDLRARIEEAADLWRARVEIAKAQWTAKLGIAGDDQVEKFDAALAKMNDSLMDTMQAMALEIEKAGKVTPELSLRLMGDASAVMAEAYDGVAALLPADKRGEVSEMPIFEFIDPSVAEPLIGVQDKIDTSFTRQRRR